MWVTRIQLGALAIFNAVTFAMSSPSSLVAAGVANLMPGDENGLSVYFIWLPPISSIVVPSSSTTTRNGSSFVLIGLDGYVLRMFCEHFDRRPVIHTDTDAETLTELYFGYTRFAAIREHHRRVVVTSNEVSIMNSR